MSNLDNSDVDKTVVRLVQKLQRVICPCAKDQSSTVVDYALQVLYGLNSSLDNAQSPAIALDMVQQKLATVHSADQARRRKFNQLRERFLRSHVLQHKASMIQTLGALAFEHSRDATGEIAARPPKLLTTKVKHKTKPRGHVTSNSVNNTGSLSNVSTSNISMPSRIQPASAILDRSIISYSLNEYTEGEVTTNNETSTSITRPIKQLPFEVSEQLLLRDLLYVFQGISGKYVMYNKQHDRFEISDAITVPDTTRRFVIALGEVGWLYKRLSEIINVQLNQTDIGTVQQSFLSAIQDELDDFFRLLSTLESQIDHLSIAQMQMSRTSINSEPNTYQVDSSNVLRDGSLTLRRLYAWMQAPRDRLRTLCMVAEGTHGIRGGALTSSLYDYANNGDPSTRSFVGGLLAHAVAPLLSKLTQWVLTGELYDDMGEFFITANDEIGHDDLWRRKYSFRMEMLPKFIDRTFAHDILLVGKSINFIRHCCDDNAWVLRTTNALRNAHPTASLLADDGGASATTHQKQNVASNQQNDLVGSFEDEWATTGLSVLPKLQSLVSSAVSVTSTRVMELVLGHHRLLDHIFALKRYLLLGQGDFITTLMSEIGPELDKSAVEVASSPNTLLGYLERATRASNSQYDEEDVLNRLHIKLYNANPGETGWDIFALTYHVTAPLTAVITPSVMAIYARLFRFLWQIKRVEYLLSNTWCRHMTAAHALRRHTVLARVLHQCHLLRSDMMNFILALNGYIMFEVLETSWQWLVNTVRGDEDAAAAAALGTSSVANASHISGLGSKPGTDTEVTSSGDDKWWDKNLDLAGLISAHDEYLRVITEKALLTGRSSHVGPHLLGLLEEAIKFASVQEQLYNKALTIAMRANKLANELASQGSTPAEAHEEAQRRCHRDMAMLAEEFEHQIDTLSVRYREGMLRMLEALDSGGQDLEEFRFLMLRFDFNEYYDSLHMERLANSASLDDSHF